MTLAPLTTLDSRARQVAYLDVAGLPALQIRTELKMSTAKLRIIRESPLYQALLSELHQKAADGSVEVVIDRIRREAIPSVNKLVHLRDHSEDDPVKRGCANDLLDRIPELRRVKNAQDGAGGLHLNFDQALLSRMFQVIAEDDGKDPAVVRALIEGADGVFVPEDEDGTAEAKDNANPPKGPADSHASAVPVPLDELVAAFEEVERLAPDSDKNAG